MKGRSKSADRFPGLRSMTDAQLDTRYSMAKNDFFKTRNRSHSKLAVEIAKEKNFRSGKGYSVW